MSTDIRDAFFDTIYDLAATDPNLIFLSADADAFSLKKFKQDFPDRYINVGVAEQNMVTVATGLALAGKNVFIYAILPFVTMRCYEQIKFNICGMNLPVTIVGVGVGYSFEFDGPSHHGVTDIGIMRMLPEITLCNPATPMNAAYYARHAYASLIPTCVRLDKGTLAELYDETDKFCKGMNIVKDGSDLCIVATGREVQHAHKLAEMLSNEELNVGVLDIHRLKPIDPSSFFEMTKDYRHIITLEENSIIGGLGSAIAELIIDFESAKKLKRFALPDTQCFEVGNREWLLEQNGLATRSIISGIKNWLDSSKNRTKVSS